MVREEREDHEEITDANQKGFLCTSTRSSHNFYLKRVIVKKQIHDLSALISRDALRAVEAETAWCFVHIADCCQPALSCGSDFPLVASLRCPEK